MRRVKCEDCGKPYDYENDAFCPHCGAFNQPGRQSGDIQPNTRVDGLNEKGHQNSFLHQEFHGEQKKIKIEKAGREMEKQVARLRQFMAQSAAQAEHRTRQEAETFQNKKEQNPKSGRAIFQWIVILIIIIKLLTGLLRLN